MSNPYNDSPSQPVAPIAGAETARPKRSFGAGGLAVVAVIALVLGAGAGLLLGTGSGDVSAEEDLTTACRYLEDLDPPIEDDVLGLDDPFLWRITAAGSLAVAAAAGGEEDALGEAGEGVMTAIQIRDIERMNEAIEDVLTHC